MALANLFNMKQKKKLRPVHAQKRREATRSEIGRRELSTR
jgi:hypothetical protein